jgi:hypothetical protein
VNKCKFCGDEITFQEDRQFWEGARTGGECPAREVTLEELTDTVDVALNSHEPAPEPEPAKPPHPDDVPIVEDPAAAVVGEPVAVQQALDRQVEQLASARTENARSDSTEERSWTCDEENCLNPVRDFVRLALQSASGSMVIEVRLCDMHLATVEISNSGNYMYVRTRA